MQSSLHGKSNAEKQWFVDWNWPHSDKDINNTTELQPSQVQFRYWQWRMQHLLKYPTWQYPATRHSMYSTVSHNSNDQRRFHSETATDKSYNYCMSLLTNIYTKRPRHNHITWKPLWTTYRNNYSTQYTRDTHTVHVVYVDILGTMSLMTDNKTNNRQQTQTVKSKQTETETNCPLPRNHIQPENEWKQVTRSNCGQTAMLLVVMNDMWNIVWNTLKHLKHSGSFLYVCVTQFMCLV